jgi:hypothetical protein
MHMSHDRFAIDLHAFSLQLSGDTARTVVRPLRVDFIDAMFQRDLSR